MLEKDKVALRNASPYNAVLTREQFLFYETRTTARLMNEGLSDEEILKRIIGLKPLYIRHLIILLGQLRSAI